MMRGGRALFSHAVLAAGLLAAAGAGAQQQQGTVARLKSVSGNVLVSQESGLSTGSEAQRLANGTRIITTAKSEATVLFDNGCEVHLKENERFEVEDRACALLVAQPLAGFPVAAVGPAFPAFLIPIGAGGMVILDARDRPAVSPN